MSEFIANLISYRNQVGNKFYKDWQTWTLVSYLQSLFHITDDLIDQLIGKDLFYTWCSGLGDEVTFRQSITVVTTSTGQRDRVERIFWRQRVDGGWGEKTRAIAEMARETRGVSRCCCVQAQGRSAEPWLLERQRESQGTGLQLYMPKVSSATT